jgi:hypothetical protein
MSGINAQKFLTNIFELKLAKAQLNNKYTVSVLGGKEKKKQFREVINIHMHDIYKNINTSVPYIHYTTCPMYIFHTQSQFYASF